MIYFLATPNESEVKIGFSQGSVVSRVIALQAGSPHPLKLLGVMDGDKERETALHAQFAEQRVRGEWFRGDAALLQFIRENAYPIPLEEQQDEITPARIKALRDRMGMSQSQFAWRLGLNGHRSSVSRLESGRVKPSGPLAQLIRSLERMPPEQQS